MAGSTSEVSSKIQMKQFVNTYTVAFKSICSTSKHSARQTHKHTPWISTEHVYYFPRLYSLTQCSSCLHGIYIVFCIICNLESICNMQENFDRLYAPAICFYWYKNLSIFGCCGIRSCSFANLHDNVSYLKVQNAIYLFMKNWRDEMRLVIFLFYYLLILLYIFLHFLYPEKNSLTMSLNTLNSLIAFFK